MIVFEEMLLSKIHFLFTMLNTSLLFVMDHRQRLKGIVTKMQFIKKRKAFVEKPKQSMNDRVGYEVTIRDPVREKIIMKDALLCKVGKYQDVREGEMITLLVKDG